VKRQRCACPCMPMHAHAEHPLRLAPCCCTCACRGCAVKQLCLEAMCSMYGASSTPFILKSQRSPGVTHPAGRRVFKDTETAQAMSAHIDSVQDASSVTSQRTFAKRKAWFCEVQHCYCLLSAGQFARLDCWQMMSAKRERLCQVLARDCWLCAYSVAWVHLASQCGCLFVCAWAATLIASVCVLRRPGPLITSRLRVALWAIRTVTRSQAQGDRCLFVFTRVRARHLLHVREPRRKGSRTRMQAAGSLKRPTANVASKRRSEVTLSCPTCASTPVNASLTEE
jgi:hypothetical protein